MNEQTTIRIFKDNAAWIKRCCYAFNMGTAELIREWERQVKMKKQQEFYNSLPMPNKYIKPLFDIRKRKQKRYDICIQEGMASYT